MLLQTLPNWATETTLKNIVVSQGRELDKNIAEVNKIVKKLGLTEIVTDVNGIVKDNRRNTDKFVKNMDKVGREFERGVSGMGRVTDPLQGFSEVAGFVGKGLQASGNAVDGLTDFLGRRLRAGGNIFGAGARGAGAGISGMAAFSGALAPLIMEQEKNVRRMIEFGATFDNGLTGATEMRREAAQMGMSIEEMFTQADGMRTMLANIGPDIGQSTKGFFDFTGHLAANSRNDRGFNQFGLIATDFSKAMAQTATMLFSIGELETLNTQTKRRIADTFMATQALALGVAELSGLNREQLLNNALSAEASINIQGALLRQSDYIANKYGDDSVLQIRQNSDYLQTLFSTMLPQLGESNERVMSTFIQRLNVTDNVEQAITPELQEIFALGDGQMAESYRTLLEDALTGKIDRTEITKRFRDLVNLTADLPFAPPVNDTTFEAFNRLVNEANVVSENFREATDAEIDNKIESAGEKVEEADDSIEAIEATKVALRTLQHQVVPGYEFLGGLFGGATEQLAEFRDMLIDTGFIEDRTSTSVDELVGPLTPGQGFEPGSSPELSGYGGAFNPNSNIGIGGGFSDESYVPPPVSTTPGSSTRTVTEADADPGLGEDRIVYNNQGATRNKELSEALFTVLNNAAIVTDPNMAIHITSGGQDRAGTPNARRTGSTRHDDGNAADLEVHVSGEKLPINDPLHLSFIRNAFALGAKGGSADHDYMGSYRTHLDIIGTSHGGTARWNFTPAFAQAQDEGLALAADPNNEVVQRLRQLQEEERTQVDSEITTPVQTVQPEPTRIRELQQEIQQLENRNTELETSRAEARRNPGEHNQNTQRISVLARELADITRSMQNEAVVADGVEG